jgi:hypothetical protein
MTDLQRRALLVPESLDVAALGSRGSGKSTMLALLALQHVELHGENARVLLVRRSHFGIQHLQSICLRLFMAAYGKAMSFTSQPGTIRARGGMVTFNQIETESDLQKYMSGSYSFIGTDQADEYPEPALLDLLRSLLRAPVRTRFVLCANAGNIGSWWVKQRFISPGAKPWQPFVEQQSGRTFVVVRSRLTDNQFVDQNAYTEQLRASAASDPQRLRQWLDDDWDAVRDGMFSDLWRRDVHVLEPFDIPRWWKVERSFDWGSTRPFSVGWWATSDGTPVKLRDGSERTFQRGSAIRIGEWYGWNGEPNRGLRMHSTAIAAGIVEREKKMQIWGRVVPGPADSSIFDFQDGHSIATEMALPPNYIRWVPANKGPNSRVHGWERMREMLKNSIPVEGYPSEGPGLYCVDTCTQFVRTVPVAPRDRIDPDDIDTAYEDHILDETRYHVHRKPRTAQVVNMFTGVPIVDGRRHY